MQRGYGKVGVSEGVPLGPVSSPSSLMGSGSGGDRTEGRRAEGREGVLYGFQVWAAFSASPFFMLLVYGLGQCRSDRGLGPINGS